MEATHVRNDTELLHLTFRQVKPEAPLPHGPDHDICSIIPCRIAPGDYSSIPTGLSANVPPGMVLLLCSKRSMAESAQVYVMNAPAIVHPKSTDEVVVILRNDSCVFYNIEEGQPIAQVILVPVVDFKPVFEKAEHNCISDENLEDNLKNHMTKGLQ